MEPSIVASPPAKPRLLTADELAKRLGVSKATIRAWTLKRTIPFIKLGRSVRFSEPAIEEWIARNSRPPVE